MGKSQCCKQTIKSYRIKPICGKIFQRLLYNIAYFFSRNSLLFPNQSGFRPGDSCINQLLLINHEILNAFDMGLKFVGYSLISVKCELFC